MGTVLIIIAAVIALVLVVYLVRQAAERRRIARERQRQKLEAEAEGHRSMADDHQRKNAEVLQRAGAAEVLEQKDLSGAALAERILALIGDPARRQRMASEALALARPEAARLIVDRALELARP